MKEINPNEQVDVIVGNLFPGTPSDAVIAILVLVVLGLCFAVYKMSKRLDEKDKLMNETVQKSNEELKKLSEAYLQSITRIHEQQMKQSQALNDSLKGTQGLLAEIRTVLSFISPPKNGN